MSKVPRRLEFGALLREDIFVSVKIRVYDHNARKWLFRVSRKRAEEMVDKKTAFVLSISPFAIALCRGPRVPATLDGRPDVSLTMPPSVVASAAEGVRACQMIVDGYKPNHEGRI